MQRVKFGVTGARHRWLRRSACPQIGIFRSALHAREVEWTHRFDSADGGFAEANYHARLGCRRRRRRRRFRRHACLIDDDGLPIDPLRAAARAAARSRARVDHRSAHRRSQPGSRQPPGARRCLKAAPRAWRWSSRARRTPSATACRQRRRRRNDRSRRLRWQPVHLRVDAHPKPRPAIDWLVALRHARRVDPMRLSLAFGIDPAAIFAGTGRCACRSRRCRPRCRSRWRISSRWACRACCSRPTAASTTMPAPPKRRNSARCCRPPSRTCACSRKPASRCVYAAPHIGFAISVDQDQFAVDGQDPGAAPALARSRRMLLDPALAGHDPCRDLLPDDDREGPRDQHPALGNRHLRRGAGGADTIDPALHDCARPAGRLRPARRAQHPAGHGR
jgi:hypothetical protein